MIRTAPGASLKGRYAPGTVFLALSLAFTVAISAWIQHVADRGRGDLSGIFYRLLIIQDAHAAILMVFLLGIALLVAGRHRWESVIDWCGRKPTWVAGITGAAVAAGALLVYRDTRLSMDEYIAYFQSQAFASGKLAGSFPVGLKEWLIPNGFLTMSDSTGEVVSGYFPGFALLLTPFTWLGIPWACNALVTGLTVLVVHRLAIKLHGTPQAAGLAVLLTVASPVIFANGISYYSMAACMLANATFALLLLSEPVPRRLFMAGLVGSIALTLHSPARHVPFAIPWLAWLAVRPGGLRNVLWIGAGYLPLTGLLGAGWSLFVADLNETTLGEAQARIVGIFSWPTYDMVIARIGGFAKIWLWAVPGLVLIAAAGFWKRRHDLRFVVLAASAVSQALAFMFVVYDQGHGWGFRYFHAVWFVLPVLAGAVAPTGGGDEQSGNGSRGLLRVIAVTALLSLAVGIGARAVQIRSFIGAHLTQEPAYHGTEPRAIFINLRDCFYCWDLVQNDPFLRDGVIRMRSNGSARNAALSAQYWPDYGLVYADERGEVYSAASGSTRSEPAQSANPGRQ